MPDKDKQTLSPTARQKRFRSSMDQLHSLGGALSKEATKELREYLNKAQTLQMEREPIIEGTTRLTNKKIKKFRNI